MLSEGLNTPVPSRLFLTSITHPQALLAAGFFM